MRTRADIRNFWLLASLAAAITAVGLGAAYYMAVHGHIVSGMSNQIVWGLPHVFAIFMIVAASGVLNVASVGTVFGQAVYKKRAPLAGLLSIALLSGGLMVLMLDLGRPDRVLIAATHYNFTSVFAWNVFLYSGMVAIVVVYLWTIFERGMNKYSKPVGMAVLVWRFVLTTGTGSIFAFLVARQAFQSALLAPLFIVLSLGWGQAVFLITQSAMYAWNGRVLDDAIRQRMARLLGIFIVATLYLVAVYYLTNLYYAKQVSFVRFMLVDGGIYPLLFWGGFVLIGSVLPLLLLFHPKLSCVRTTLAASALVVAGAFAFLYVFIVGGQAFPLEIFPGHAVSSSFADGAVGNYVPRLPELLLGVGGLGAALLLTVVGLRAFNCMPQDDAVSAKACARG